MKNKKLIIIIILIVLAILLCCTTYMLITQHQESYITLRISNSCSIKVPNSENTVENLDGNLTKYIFNANGLNITHQKSANNSEIKSLQENEIKNSQLIEDNIYYNADSNTYTKFIENNETNDALLISSTDLNLLKNVSNSVEFNNSFNISSENNATGENTSYDSTDTSSENTNYNNNQYYNTNTYSQGDSNETSGEKSSQDKTNPDDEVIIR